jgi:hypothetical protein
MTAAALRERTLAFTGPVCDKSPSIAAAVELSGA